MWWHLSQIGTRICFLLFDDDDDGDDADDDDGGGGCGGGDIDVVDDDDDDKYKVMFPNFFPNSLHVKQFVSRALFNTFQNWINMHSWIQNAFIIKL